MRKGYLRKGMLLSTFLENIQYQPSTTILDHQAWCQNNLVQMFIIQTELNLGSRYILIEFLYTQTTKPNGQIYTAGVGWRLSSGYGKGKNKVWMWMSKTPNDCTSQSEAILHNLNTDAKYQQLIDYITRENVALIKH